MDGVYHPLWAAFPNNPTLRGRTLVPLLPISGPYGALTLFGVPFQVNFGLASSGSGQSASPDHNSPRRDKADGEISDLGFFPLRSPLLRESLLVSLPPLIDMLKFSGWVSLDLRPQKNNCLLTDTGNSSPTKRGPRQTLPAPVRQADRRTLHHGKPHQGNTKFTYEVRAGSNRPKPSPTRPQHCLPMRQPTADTVRKPKGKHSFNKIHGPQPNVPRQRADGAQCAFDDSMIH